MVTKHNAQLWKLGHACMKVGHARRKVGHACRNLGHCTFLLVYLAQARPQGLPQHIFVLISSFSSVFFCSYEATSLDNLLNCMLSVSSCGYSSCKRCLVVEQILKNVSVVTHKKKKKHITICTKFTTFCMTWKNQVFFFSSITGS